MLIPFYDFDTFYANREQEPLTEVFSEERVKKTVLRADLIADVVPRITQLMLQRAKRHPPKKCDWIFMDKNKIATWEMYRIENIKVNPVSINLMPMQVPTPEFCKTPNGGLIWVSEDDGVRRFQDYVNLCHYSNAFEPVCLKMINLASNFGITSEEIDSITNVLFQ